MDLRDWYYLLRAAMKREDGQTMAEYGVVLAIITVGIITALGLLAVAISGKLGSVKNVLSSALPTA
jgi:Flp pilus assembly pilin Flp